MPRPKKTAPNRGGKMYEAKVIIGRDIDGKAIRKSFYSPLSLEDAKRKGQEYIIAQKTQELTGACTPQECTFSEWAKKWLETYKKPYISENTYVDMYLLFTEKYLIPYFGNAHLINIRQADVQKFFGQIQNDLSESSLNKIKICLNGIFESAIENDLCFKNPVKHVVYSAGVEKIQKDVYTDEQIPIVKEFFRDRMPEVIVALETGMRRGEILGMMWQDIDFDDKTIKVNRSIVDKKGGGTEIRPPKWDSYRTIPISTYLCEYLRRIPRRTMYVFPTDKGKIQSPRTWSHKLTRNMARLHEEHPNVPELTAHELRHTRGTQLRRNGADIYTIQKIMGHKDINVTASVYVHDEVEITRAAAKIV